MRSAARMGRALWIGILGAGAAYLLADRASAQSAADRYPDRPIRIIVPFPPGGSVDLVARVLGQRMTENSGQPVVIMRSA